MSGWGIVPLTALRPAVVETCAGFEPDSLATSYSGTQGHKARQIPGQATAFRRSLLLYNAFLQQVSRQALQAASIFYDGETEAQS